MHPGVCQLSETARYCEAPRDYRPAENSNESNIITGGYFQNGLNPPDNELDPRAVAWAGRFPFRWVGVSKVRRIQIVNMNSLAMLYLELS